MTQQTGMVGIAAVVLAAGRSQRMGEPKLPLPFGRTTVIGQVVGVLAEAGLAEIVVVTGAAEEPVRSALAGAPVQLVHNPQYEKSEMLTSLQTGIRALTADAKALLVTLGDQPTIEASVVRAVIDAYHSHGARLVVPSYQMRRGHPWLADRSTWADLLALDETQTMRDFLRAHEREIHYVTVDTPGVLMDMDTPEDYRRLTS